MSHEHETHHEHKDHTHPEHKEISRKNNEPAHDHGHGAMNHMHEADQEVPQAEKEHSHHHMPANSQHSEHEDHDDHHAMMVADFRKRFFVSLIITVPILLLSPMIQMFMGVDWRFSGDSYLLFGLSTVLFFYGGKPFLTGARDELRKKSPAMMTLVALSITVAYIYSTLTVFFINGDDFFWELATLIVIMLLGHWIEMKSVMGASRALDELVKLMPEEAHLIVVTILKLSKATYQKMRQNLIWATGYNMIALPLAAGVLYYQGIIINPAVGAALMSVSTIIVAINAKLLKID